MYELQKVLIKLKQITMTNTELIQQITDSLTEEDSCAYCNNVFLGVKKAVKYKDKVALKAFCMTMCNKSKCNMLCDRFEVFNSILTGTNTNT